MSVEKISKCYLFLTSLGFQSRVQEIAAAPWESCRCTDGTAALDTWFPAVATDSTVPSCHKSPQNLPRRERRIWKGKKTTTLWARSHNRDHNTYYKRHIIIYISVEVTREKRLNVWFPPRALTTLGEASYSQCRHFLFSETLNLHWKWQPLVNRW